MSGTDYLLIVERPAQSIIATRNKRTDLWSFLEYHDIFCKTKRPPAMLWNALDDESTSSFIYSIFKTVFSISKTVTKVTHFIVKYQIPLKRKKRKKLAKDKSHFLITKREVQHQSF